MLVRLTAMKLMAMVVHTVACLLHGEGSLFTVEAHVDEVVDVGRHDCWCMRGVVVDEDEVGWCLMSKSSRRE
jgi:hypothetical protein